MTLEEIEKLAHLTCSDDFTERTILALVACVRAVDAWLARESYPENDFKAWKAYREARQKLETP